MTDRPWLVRWTEPDGRQRKRAFRLRRDAQAYQREIDVALSRGTYVPPAAGATTVGEWGTAWLARRNNLTASTLERVTGLWRSRVRPRWGAVRLDSVRHEHVAEWIAGMLAEGLSASRTRQAYQVLSAILADAVRARRLAVNPVAGAELPRITVTPRKYLTHEQVDQLVQAVPARSRTFVLVLAYTGLRWGEATALRAGDYDPRRRRLMVERSVTEVRGAMIVGAPKSHARRSVAVPASVAVELDAAAAGRAPDALLFPAARGGYRRNQNDRQRWWNDAAAAAGVPGLTPHELRHTAASLAVAAGANVLAVARMLGHKDPSMTLRIYADLFDDHLDDVAARMDAGRAVILARPEPALSGPERHAERPETAV